MAENTTTENTTTDPLQSLNLTSEDIHKIFSASNDVVFRDLLIRNRPSLRVSIVYMDGLCNIKIIDDNIVCPLSSSRWLDTCATPEQAYALCKNGALGVSAVQPTISLKEAVNAVLSGKTLLVFDTLKSALILDTIESVKRNITSATEEETYRSGKDSFVETLRVNTSLLRKKIKSCNLVIEETIVGRQTHTRICIVYMQNICNDAIVEKVKSALYAIDQDKALSIRDIYTNVVKEKYTPFPTAIITEKPETCSMGLLDGKVAVLIDEIPYSILFPGVFNDIFQSASDYGYGFLVASFFRIIRYVSFFISMMLPGFFIAVTSFHIEMIPYKLALSIAASRMGTPFHIYMEMLIMTVTFFILIQASMQISRTVGGTISIVGGLVLGEAAISAGFVSPAVIVVVATAAICSMAIPNKEANTALWLYQVVCTILSSFLGLIGLVIGLIFLFLSLAKLEPLGIPYLSPLTSKKGEGFQFRDAFIKYPENLIKWRPLYLNPKNKRRRR